MTTVQSFTNNLTALTSHGPSYAFATGDQIQVRDFGSSKPTTTIASPGSSAVLELTDSTLTLGVTPRETERSTIYRFDPETGEQRTQAQLTGDIELITEVGDALVCGTVESSDDDGRSVNRISLLETADLSQRWTNTVRNKAFPGETAQIDETLHIGFENFLVGFDMADGTIQYRSPLNVGYPTAYEGDLIADADRKLRRINLQTLGYEWSTGTEVSGRPVIVGDLVAVPTTNGILAADRESGEKYWSRTLEDVSGFTPELLAYHGGLFWYGTADEQLYGLVPTTGETAFSMAGDIDFLVATINGVVLHSDFEIMELTVSAAE
ncbi:PQQ-binding-like beta-propeller repeat protein [Halosimplex pelagicum]|uniref:PQQ-binding-like beta-propeller repeat protein n=1 Tax=Halosimplex pelagicum TaxID=869886 RepID=A0A7D5T485_9EURY|nr:PQQ-binding-like beta-propeller repeat protein [Halosimplex pelagicum]QLH81368.1 PQQ-binding-like beta-propeller repeat protein [Halosimplex pelagicum]